MNNHKKSSEENEQQKGESSFFLSLITLLILFGTVMAFKSSVLDANNIPSGSMIPTLKIGDYLFVNKMRYSFRLPFLNSEIVRYDDPQRGDIITFIPPTAGGKHFVKRVVGMPGDRLRIRNIPLCSLHSILSGSAASKKANDSSTVADDPFRKMANSDRDIVCASSNEPYVTFVEYRENDQGPWQNYRPRLLSMDLARKQLSDSDDARMLQPDLRPGMEYELPAPVLMEEQVGDLTHYIVETTTYPHQVEEDMGFSSSFCSYREMEGGGCIVPDDHYFVMGDNRDNSRDSRVLGPIARQNILGKVAIIYFSINWYDGICHDYLTLYGNRNSEGSGFQIEDFPPESQMEHCTHSDLLGSEGVGSWLYRTIFHRIPRMDVRWNRILKVLE